MQLCGVKAGRRLANLTVCHRRAIAGAWCERLLAIARQLHRGSVTGSAHLGRESSTSPRVILVRLCYLAALRGLAKISTSKTICTLRGLMRGLAVVACVQWAMPCLGYGMKPMQGRILWGMTGPKGQNDKNEVFRAFSYRPNLMSCANVGQTSS